MASPETKEPSSRLVSLDAYRGFVMLLMAAEALRLSRVARNFPDSAVWQFIAKHTSHVEWVGCSLHDLIQPSFSFMVGVALPYSIASRRAKGQAPGAMFGHAVFRALMLIFLGIFLRSVNAKQTNFTFEDTLTQIGLGYPLLFLLGFQSVRMAWISLGIILAGYWALFALHPLPGPAFDWAAVGVPANWPHHLSGFAQHWDKNSNWGAMADQWFMNLWPRAKPFVFNGGGYLTFSFIPTLGTMMLGLVAGRWLRDDKTGDQKFWRMVKAGVICLAAGALLHVTGVCPVVKRIWTPAWALFSGGWCFLLLAAFYGVIDLKGWRLWAFPLVVIGMNSIAMYVMAHLFDGFIESSLKIHLGQNFFNFFGEKLAPMLSGAAVVFILWLILLWMHRRKIYLRI